MAAKSIGGRISDIKNVVRAVTASVKIAVGSDALPPGVRLSVCTHLLGDGSPRKISRSVAAVLEPLREVLLQQQADERHYWISTLSTLLMKRNRRVQLAAYFTPPPLVRHLIREAERHGLDLTTANVVDPAAGGAAFVSSLAGRMQQLGCDPADIRNRLVGVEIDRHLAALGDLLVTQRLGEAGRGVFRVADSLFLPQKYTSSFDAVFVNPPYGRAFDPIEDLPPDWRDSSSLGHVNKYALFIGLALRLAKPGALVGVVAPSSFIAGKAFERLRSTIRSRSEVLRVDVLERQHVFYDVQQDACVALMRRLDSPKLTTYSFAPECGRIDQTWTPVRQGRLAASTNDLTAPWVLPDLQGNDVFKACLGRLADYGARAKAGYFVWNREKHRMSRSKSKRPHNFPLVWASNIKADRLCIPRARSGSGVDYVSIDPDNASLIKTGAVFLQRTTNNRQRRRLIAARITDKLVKRIGGVVSENHTIVVLPTRSGVRLTLVCKLLNSKAVDQVYRRVGGTASVSISSLRDLPLPFPEHLDQALDICDDFDAAVEHAYRLSSNGVRKPVPVPA